MQLFSTKDQYLDSREIMRKAIVWLLMPAIAGCLLLPDHSFAQHVLPPNQPEQDACHALAICSKFFTPYSYQGEGRVDDLPATPCGDGSAELNAVWIRVTIASAGLLAFDITPVDSTDDYDFAVLDITNENCDTLNPGEVIRCNFNGNVPGSNPMGIVGLSASSTVTEVQPGTFGNSFCEAIAVLPGQVYLIMVNNPGLIGPTGAGRGFTIDFSASTTAFEDTNPLPAFDGVVKTCSDSSVTIQLKAPVLCSSIAADGSEFYITPDIPIAGASGINCDGSQGYTSQVVISFVNHIPNGNYTLNVQNGTNRNTLLNICDGPIPLNSVLPFLMAPPIPKGYLPPDTTKCDYSTLTVASLGAFLTYAWSSGQNTPAIQVLNPGEYKLIVTDSNGCIGTDSIAIKDSACPQYVYVPNAFTPNGDGRNDLFRAVLAGAVSEYTFAVYDRLGRMVFESNDPSVGWNGTTAGTQQPVGTYVWMCIYRLYQQPQRLQKGTVLLIR
jgi:gliding motility-associated-like protein